MATAVGNANHLDRAEKAHSAVDCRVWAMLPTPKTPKNPNRTCAARRAVGQQGIGFPLTEPEGRM